MRRWRLETLLELLHLAQSCDECFEKTGFVPCHYYYDAISVIMIIILIYNLLSGTGSLLKQICCRCKEHFSCLAWAHGPCQSWEGAGVCRSSCMPEPKRGPARPMPICTFCGQEKHYVEAVGIARAVSLLSCFCKPHLIELSEMHDWKWEVFLMWQAGNCW